MIQRRVNNRTLAEVEEALRAHEQAVLVAQLSQSSKEMYVNRARLFARWLKGVFEPSA